MLRSNYLLLVVLALCIVPNARATDPIEATAALDTVINGRHRSDENRARDRHRHPRETLTFFGLSKDMTVVELWPGGGWYTEILAPFLKDSGKLIVASFGVDAKPAFRANMHEQLLEKFKASPEYYNQVEVVVLNPPKHISLGEKDSVDRVLTFRNTHNWINGGIEQAVYQAAYDVLKPGGTLGVVQHRGKDEWDPKRSAKNGYVPVASIVKMAEGIGFKLAASSEINANPKDTKDHAEGVWTLPPRYRLGEQDREKYAAIGESDRMTLKFVKPAN